MIATLTGLIASKNPPFLILNVMGVGYEVQAPLSSFGKWEKVVKNESITILTVHIVREDSQDLYGFATDDEKNLFKTLIKVNGIGPKIAIGILSASGVDGFIANINSANIDNLVCLPGIGKKTAQRLIIEMKDKLTSKAGNSKQEANFLDKNSQVISALTNLGFKSSVAQRMLAGIDSNNKTIDEILRLALKNN
ncbi:MAG: Holliday junction branch migration protein RuvA [Gammaproteobacteria bacterium]|nr:MAG: Holliday junction branch migration protein RuvA [Gammaproteobacteria bacterium]